MKISAINNQNQRYTSLQTNHNLRYASKTNNNGSNDVFVKQNSDISFSGFRKKKSTETKVENDLATSLKDVSIEGSIFLLGLASSLAMTKLGIDAAELLLNKAGYLINENGVTGDGVTIDEKEGIIKFAGTGIEIDADKYDYVDWKNGIFKNYDGSVDIDLGNNKFIDTENGIFVDPSEKIAAVLDGDSFENIAIPSFGSGYPTMPNDDRWATINGRYGDEYEQEENVLQKASSYIKSLFGDGSDAHNITETKDIFGNDIMIATDKDGDTYLTSIPHVTDNPVFAKFQKTLGGDRETAVETFNNMRLQAYLTKKYPAFGTRVLVYEGGRHSGSNNIAPIQERYDGKIVQEVLNKISADGGYVPKSGSEEAINFVKYQHFMIKNGFWEKPMLSVNNLLDIDGDGKPDIDLDGDGKPDSDIDGDGIIDFSSESGGGILGATFRFLKGLKN